jgi:hypothetical protein
MDQCSDLRADARDFVTTALGQFQGRAPSEKTIAVTVERIVRALAPVVSAKPAGPSKPGPTRRRSR